MFLVKASIGHHFSASTTELHEVLCYSRSTQTQYYSFLLLLLESPFHGNSLNSRLHSSIVRRHLLFRFGGTTFFAPSTNLVMVIKMRSSVTAALTLFAISVSANDEAKNSDYVNVL
jgi:hypothetical protein